MSTTASASTDTRLDREMAQILARMQLVATGNITNYSPTGRSAPSSKPPAGVRLDGASPVAMHVHWHRKWVLAIVRDRESDHPEAIPTTRARQEALNQATEALGAVRKQTRIIQHTETQEQLETRIIDEADGWEADQVARAFGVTARFVRQARLRNGRIAHTGKHPDEQPGEMEDKRKHAQALAANGMTERQIEMITGLPKTSVRRALGRAA